MLSNVLLFPALSWLVVHVLHHYWCTKSPLLPLTRNRSAFRVRLNKLHLLVESTACNVAHDGLCRFLRQTLRFRRALELFYDFGSVLAVLGMLVALGLVFWVLGSSSLDLFREPAKYGKRDLDAVVKPIVSTVLLLENARTD